MKILFTVALLFSVLHAADEPEQEIASLSTSQVDQTPFSHPNLPTSDLKQEIPLLAKPYRNPLFAVSLAFVPGLGHVYLGDLRTAGALFGSASISSGLAQNKFTFQYSQLASVQNTIFYSVFAAYRDVRINNEQKGYHYQMPNDNFQDLAFAPFRFSVIKKPEVWGGFLGALTAGAVISYFAFPDDIETSANEANCIAGPGPSLFPLSAFSIGLGEEAFFRGYVQSFFAERMSPTSAIVISSLVFGAAHIPNAQFLPKEIQWRYYTFSLPLISTFGGYMGWLAHKNHSLKESVALHAWYDFALMLGYSLAAPSAALGSPTFAISLPF